MFTRLLNYDSSRPCHVIDNRCGTCQACKNTRR